MGEQADFILEGDSCQECGIPMEGDGYPQTCGDCLELDKPKKKRKRYVRNKNKN